MRTDTHRPSAINPAEYEYVAPEHIKVQGFGDCAYVLEMRRRIQEHMLRTGGTYSGHEHGGNCMVCGSVNAIYTVLFYHRPTNTYIRTGQDCADKLGMGYNRNEINLFHTAIKAANELRAGKRKAQAVLVEKGVSWRAWDVYSNPEPYKITKRGHDALDQEPAEYKVLPYEEETITDIVGKLVRYGSVSDAQVNFLNKLIDKIEQRPAIEAQRKAEAEKALPVPTGRVKITGEVLSLKTVDGWQGEPQTKVLIRSTDGFKIWGNRFANVEKGDKITFTATLEPSKDDPKFGFFKRPKIEADVNFQPIHGVVTRVCA